MRLHTLELRALGPFAGEERVDFDALGASGLFLLEGPTGAGKSTVLDAVTFALYGEPAAQGSSRARLVSDLAAPDAEPSVTLEFSVSGVRHRLLRVPAHVRARRRGSGTTRDPGRVCLQRLEPDGRETTLSTRADEVGLEVARLLGLTRTQFTQVVVLPQGEFARFLQAPAEQRREVLERLFGTEIYDALQDQVLALRREATTAVEAARREVDAAVAALAAAAAVDPPADDADTRGWSGGVLAAVAARRDIARDEVTAAAVARAGAQASLAEATTRVEAWERRDALRRREQALAAERDDRDADARRLADADRAASVEALIEELVGAARARRDADVAARGAAAAVAATTAATTAPDVDLVPAAVLAVAAAGDTSGAAAGDSADAAGSQAAVGVLDEPVLSAAVRVVRRRSASLAGLAAREERLPDLVEQVAQHEKTVLETGRQLEELAESARRFPQRLETATARVEERRRARAALPELRLRHDAARARADAGAAWVVAVAVAEAAAATARRLGDAARSAVDEHQTLLQRRLDGMAAELAAGLAPGSACPVCGSADHPSPARPADDAVTAAAVDDAARARRAAEREAEQARRSLADAEAEVTRLAALALAGADGAAVGTGADELPFVDPAGLEATAAALAAALGAAESTAADLDDAEEELATVERERAEADRLRGDLEVERDRARADLAEAVATEAAERAAVLAARGGWPSVAARIEGLEELAERLSEAAAAVAAVTRTATAERRLQARAAVRAREAGFGDDTVDDGACLLSAGAAVLPAAVRAELRGRCSAYDAEVAAVATALADPALALDDSPLPDLAELRASAAVAERAWSDRHEAAAVAETRAADATARAEVLTAALDAADAAEVAAGPARRMADLVTGGQGNLRRMTLPTYVLRSRFLSVVAAASRRLERMSSGRYSFEFEEEGSGNQRAGLGLVVLDAFSGRRRPVATLSGGETFYASLALALGLADVVRSEAGGVELETLFVDEGFGSLDPDTLDSVLGVLDDLRDAGRVVGVVSHVAELKERVPDRLEVRRLPSGASTLRQRS